MKKADYDGAWKNWTLFHLQETLAFFQPELEQVIDWNCKPEFLDKSFQNEFYGSKDPRREVDMLVKIQLQTGDEKLLLLHIEFQHSKEDHFEQRMYIYHCRIYAHFGKEVFSLGILGDDDPNWRPKQFGYNCFGCTLQFQFPCVKLLDFQERIPELEASKSPIAIIILAQLAAIQGQQNAEYRYQAKFRLLRMLFDKGRDKQQIRHLLSFLELVLKLEDEMEETLYQQLKEEDLVDAVLLESYPARKAKQLAHEEGLEEGREEGREEGMSEALETILENRFGAIPQEIKQRLKESDLDQLRKWLIRASTLNQLQDVFA